MNESSEISGRQPVKKRRAGPVFGIAVYGIGLLLLVFAAAPIQYRWGLPGVAVTELIILLLGLLPALIFRLDLRRVFPLAMPRPRQVGGVTLIWLGFLSLSVFCSMVLVFLFPRRMLEISSGIGGLSGSLPLVLSLLVIAALPAICEEVLFRGLIQHTFRGVSPWLTIFIIGALFGAFHMHPLRMLPTGILGVGLAYVMRKTGNLLLPIFFHFINNALSTLMVCLTGRLDGLPAGAGLADYSCMPPAILLVMCLYLVLPPVFILMGAILIEPKRPLIPRRYAHKRKQIVIAVTCSLTALLLFFIGVGLLAAGNFPAVKSFF